MIQHKSVLRHSQIALAISSMLLAQSALAQEFIKGGDEKFVFNLGGILNQFDSNVRLDGSTGQGTELNLEGNGLKKSLSSLQASGTWRIADRHRVDFVYFSANRSGSHVYNKDITIGDNVIAAGATVSAETKAQFLWLDYRYSFMKSDAFELAGVFGLYGGTFKTNVSATATVGSGGAGGSAAASNSASTTLPLPLLGVSGDWYISPRWKVSSALEGMSAKIGGIDGTATNFSLGTDFMITRNWGIGAAWLYTKISADATKDDFNGKFNWNANGISLYATAKF